MNDPLFQINAFSKLRRSHLQLGVNLFFLGQQRNHHQGNEA